MLVSHAAPTSLCNPACCHVKMAMDHVLDYSDVLNCIDNSGSHAWQSPSAHIAGRVLAAVGWFSVAYIAWRKGMQDCSCITLGSLPDATHVLPAMTGFEQNSTAERRCSTSQITCAES